MKVLASTIIFVFSLLFGSLTQAREVITILTPYSAGHSGNVAFQRVLEQANATQSQYTFVLELKPGAQGIIALKSMSEDPANRLAVIHAAFVDNVDSGQIRESDFRPVHAIGDACWAVVSLNGRTGNIASLRDTRELTIGTVGFGNVTHLTGLAIAERLGLQTRLVVFKSNYDAVVNLAGNNGVTFGIERVAVIEQFQRLNPNIRMLAMSCPTRYSAAPNLPTLAEQGIQVPGVFNIVVSDQRMNSEKSRAMGAMLDQATRDVGLTEIQRISDMRSPVFDGISAERFFRTRIQQIRQLRSRFSSEIAQSKNN
jgi:tripartite-type tricarboxylate transporter receptor subunit TctC